MFESLRFPVRARVLDVGCGDGSLTAGIAQQVSQGFVLGLDRQQKTVDDCRQRYPQYRFFNLRFRVAEATSLDFELENFDFVVSRGCLHYLAHPGMAFAAIARHLKPGGVMLINCLGKGNLLSVNRAFEKQIASADWAPHFRDYKFSWGLVEPKDCDSWLESAGLVKQKAGLVNEGLDFPHKAAFLQWFSANWGAYLQGLTSELKERFLEEFYSQTCGFKKKPPRLQRVWLHLQAVKAAQP